MVGIDAVKEGVELGEVGVDGLGVDLAKGVDERVQLLHRHLEPAEAAAVHGAEGAFPQLGAQRQLARLHFVVPLGARKT